MDDDRTMQRVTECDRFQDGITWTLEGESLLACRAHALVDDDGGVWLVDPIDGDGLDELVAPLGGVAGVVVLLDRHLRDAPAIAARHAAPLLVPPGRWRRGHPMPDEAITLGSPEAGDLDPPFAFAPMVERGGQWLEWALWWPDRRVLVLAELVGASSFYSPGDEPWGLHPAMQLLGAPSQVGSDGDEPFRDELAEGEFTLLVGHGAAAQVATLDQVESLLRHPRRGIPGLVARMPLMALRTGMAKRSGIRSGC